MDLFSQNGHITDEGLQAVINEKLTEMQRLEASEHLSFCDDCLVRYTNMLENVDLYVPSQPMLPPIRARLRQKLVRVIFSKYATAAAAVALAATLTIAGVFSPSNISSVANAITINNIFNISAPAPQKSNVPKIPDVKIPKKEQPYVPEKNKATDNIIKKQEDKKEENPAKLAAQKENPLLQFFAPKRAYQTIGE